MNPASDRGRILVLRGGALGDFVLTLPVLQALREEFPGTPIALGAYSWGRTLADMTGWVDETHSLDHPRFARLFALRPAWTDEDRDWWRKWSLVLHFLHDPEGSIPQNLEDEGLTRVFAASPMVEGRHACDHLLAPLQQLAIFSEGQDPHLPIEPDTQRLDREAPGAVRVLLQPGSGSCKKNWPVEHFIDLARRVESVGAVPLWVLGEVEREWIDLPSLPGVVLPPLGVDELAGVCRAADAWVGNDAGTTHLAAATGCRTVALFGPTDPGLWAPRGGHVRVVEAPGGEMSRLELSAVLEALASWLPELSRA